MTDFVFNRYFAHDMIHIHDDLVVDYLLCTEYK